MSVPFGTVVVLAGLCFLIQLLLLLRMLCHPRWRLHLALAGIFLLLTVALVLWTVLPPCFPEPEYREILDVSTVFIDGQETQVFVVDWQTVNANRYFRCVLPPGAKVERTVYKKVYYGIRHNDEDLPNLRDTYRIVEPEHGLRCQ